MKISARLSLSGPALTRGRMLLVVAAFGALSVAVVPWVVLAATQTWTGGGAVGSGWANPNNWNSSAGPSPSNGDDVVLAQVQGNPPNNFDINVTLHSITLNTPAQGIVAITNAGGFVLGLQNGGFITDNSTSGPDAINTGITLNGLATFTASAGATGLSFGVNPITGTGGLTLVNNSGNDALLLNLANTYTGATAVNGTGRVKANVNGAIPTSSALTVNGSALFQETSTIGSLAGGGNVFMNGSNTLTAGGDDTSTIFSGVYQNSGGSAALTKRGSGTLTLSGANTYTGATAAVGGTLAVNGSLTSPVTVRGTLAGTGTINNTVTVISGGKLSPGTSPGILNTGAVYIGVGGTLTVELNGPTVGTQYDQVNVTGTVTLQVATLNVVRGFVPTAGQVFTIINNDGSDAVTGGFVPGGTIDVGGIPFTISYVGGDGNDVTLTAPTSPANVSGTKAKSGGSTVGSTVTYTVILANSSTFAQLDNPGNEFTDVLPSGLTLFNASAPSGATTVTPGTNTVTWSGSIGGHSSVTITITATINSGTALQTITNQGTINYDADGNATNEASRMTDDPAVGGASDPTSFTVISPANVSGTKTKAGGNMPASTVTYTVVLSNGSSSAQLDNPGNEFTDVLPSELTLVSANATGGTATTGVNTVSWNGGIAGSGSVTITITATINSVPDGTIVSNQGSISYDADGNGTNEASRLTDDPSVSGASNPTNFTVNDVNDPPDAVNDALSSVAEDSGLRTIPFSVLTNNDSKGPANESGQTLIVKTVSNPVGLTVSIVAGTVRFTPLPDYYGPASFQYTVEDNGTTNGVADPKTSAPALVHFNITEVNDAPTAVNDTLPNIPEDSGPQTIPFATLTANDSKGPANESSQTLIVKTVGNPVGGTVGIVGGNVLFTPTANYNGPASFDYTVEDNGTTNGIADPKTSGPATASFSITSAADTPSVTNATTNANTQTTSGLVISRNPADGAEVTHFKITGITGGSLFKNNGITPINNGDFITFAEGNAGLKFTPGTINGSFTVQASTSASDAGLGGGTSTATILINPLGGVIRFSASSYSVAEGAGFKTITVERSGDTSQAVTVDYASSDHSTPADFVPCTSPGAGFASSRCDFTTAIGTLRFGAGETSKTFTVLISNDNYVEGPETLSLTLSNPSGGAVFGVPLTATLTIIDDASEPATNPIDISSFFVTAHYHDFLKREPDAAGLAFWTDNIEKCNDPARRPTGQTAVQCIDKQRESTAVAFFSSPEFQITGGFVYRLYKGSLTGSPNYDGGSPGRFPTSLEFMRDVSQVSEGIVVNNQISGAVVEANRNRLAAEFVQRPEFVAKYGGLNNTLYVQQLFNTTTIAATAAEKQALVDGLGNGTETKASVLRKIVDGTVVVSEGNVQFTTAYGQAFYNQEFRRVFVFMEYIGYLRRNPDAAGFVFWLGKLNQYNGDPFQAEMVRSFILSPEYRSRFGQP